MNAFALSHVSSNDLLISLRGLVRKGNELTAQVLAHLAEAELRGLHLEAGCSSMFSYCTEVLHLAEAAAYKRIGAARVARRHPVIFSMVASGELHLSGVCELAQHLTDANHEELLAAARHRSKRSIERLVVERFPRPDVPATIRKLPAARAASSEPCTTAPGTSLPASAVAAPAPDTTVAISGSKQGAVAPSVPPPSPSTLHSAPSRVGAGRAKPRAIEPLAPARYRLTLTMDQALHDKLAQARALLSHQVPDGDVAEILDRALTLLIAERMKSKFASRRPRAGRRASKRRSRHIPSQVKREVLARDGARCTFVGSEGRRCTATHFLEFDHVVPYARGGRHVPENLRLVCAAHNRHRARWQGLRRPTRQDTSPRGKSLCLERDDSLPGALRGELGRAPPVAAGALARDQR